MNMSFFKKNSMFDICIEIRLNFNSPQKVSHLKENIDNFILKETRSETSY